jgi:hypothetical protein
MYGTGSGWISGAAPTPRDRSEEVNHDRCYPEHGLEDRYGASDGAAGTNNLDYEEKAKHRLCV